MRNDRVQFAVVREDPEIERAVVERIGATKALLVASGGCTALSLRSWLPRLELTLIDPNPAQLDLVRRKLAALRDPSLVAGSLPWRAMFNVGQELASGLNQCGNFESLFRQLRAFVNEFVAPDSEVREFFDRGSKDRSAPRAWIANPYWPVAFELFFSDAMLEAMFTPAATRHAERGSFPRHFRARFEHGLLRGDARANYFLHHVLLGAYRDDPKCWPEYLRNPPTSEALESIEMLGARLEEVADFAPYDCVSLSNTLDWMDDAAIDALLSTLERTLRPGSAIVYRKLNHALDVETRLRESFDFAPEFASDLASRDRSLFYSSVHVGIRRNGRASAGSR